MKVQSKLSISEQMLDIEPPGVVFVTMKTGDRNTYVTLAINSKGDVVMRKIEDFGDGD